MNDRLRRWLISLMLPFLFLVVFPIAVIILKDTNRITCLASAPIASIVLAVGIFLILLGFGLLIATIPLFLKLHEGTNMPWEPAPELILEGVYRHMRNPMHAGVFLLMLGEGLILRSSFLLVFTACAVVLHLFYIPYSEERGLEKRFGEAYRTYKQHVPRWIPRLTPWDPGIKFNGE
ncbi:MAG: isoprenylcysteine carboxylmethyltransferase family protein [Anaerolineales bacterium]